MCGRIAHTLPVDAMARLFSAVPDNNLPVPGNYNVCPTDQVAVVVAGDRRRLKAMRWGFVPAWYKTPSGGPMLVNARAETLADKPAFREACRTRRCLIPVSGFYEWTKDAGGGHDPWYFSSDTPIVFAGIWQSWGQGDDLMNTCAIVTCGANDAVSHIHHRMPVILEPDSWTLWLGESQGKAAPLMQPAAEDRLSFHRVGRAVNSNKASGPELIEPLIED